MSNDPDESIERLKAEAAAAVAGSSREAVLMTAPCDGVHRML
jgi:hypothetical protein